MRRSLAVATLALMLGSCSLVKPRQLVACADPNNLPFSNRSGQGFENKLAQMVASDLHARLSYVWWAQRRGYVRNTLNENTCDFWPGIGSNVEMVATSRPYYRSTYMFVTRADDQLGGLSLDDPRLGKLKIGVQMVGNDQSNTPPAHALASRGIIGNVEALVEVDGVDDAAGGGVEHADRSTLLRRHPGSAPAVQEEDEARAGSDGHASLQPPRAGIDEMREVRHFRRRNDELSVAADTDAFGFGANANLARDLAALQVEEGDGAMVFVGDV